MSQTKQANVGKEPSAMGKKPSATENETANSLRLNKRLKDTPIAIVGMASIFANSRYLNQFWDLICDKIDAITDVPNSHWQIDDYFDTDKNAPDKSYCKRGGFIPEVDFNPMEFGLPPNILELTDTSQLLSLVIAKEVLADAGVSDDYDTNKIGITLGVGGGQKINHSLSARLQYPVLKKVFKNSGISDADSEMLIKKFQDQYIHWEENSFPGSLGNVIAGRIANRFNFGGMNCVVDAACAGSLAAMRMALTELVEGRSEMMITGGVCTDNSPQMYMSFSKTPAFTTNDTIQPFDIDSKGMMIGEGIGMLALKRLEDAERDGDRIYSVIKGVGSSSDGKFKSIYAPRPEGQAKALKRAYEDAGFAPETVGLIEAHGTGTAAGDVAEFNGLTSVFSENNEQKQHIALGSVKSQIGHTKSTAGTAGVIKAALALHHKVLPPTINVDKPSEKLNVADSPFYINSQTRPWLPDANNTPRRAGISSFGFGGTNFHLALEEYNSEHQRGDKYRQRQVPQSLLLSANSKAELSSLANDVINQVNAAIDANAALSKQTENRGSNSNYLALCQIANTNPVRVLDANTPRLGLVASSLNELKTQLEQAIKKLASDEAAWQLPSGTSYRAAALIDSSSAPNKVAALFAGQGSQYVNMGIELSCLYPEMRAQVMKADSVFNANGKTLLSRVLYPIPAFEKADKDAQAALLTQTNNAQSAIGAMSMGQYELFTQAGFSADMVAGHSFGELSALCAAKVISTDDYYQLAFARGAAMASDALDADGKAKDKGAMYAIILTGDEQDEANASNISTLEQIIAKFDGVKVANYNSATQLVIAGPTDTCADAAKAITELGFKAINLPVSGAFHTPLVGHAQKPFADAIDKVKFSASKLELYSNATAQVYPSNGKSIKSAFKQHMLQSVRFTEQLIAMYDAGARVFVEFGPKNILQKLVEATLGKHSDVAVISLNPKPKADSDTQLRIAAMQLSVLGQTIANIDPYQAEIAAEAEVKGMNVKLSGVNYISPATRAKMQKSLETGEISSQIVEKVVETVVEKIVEVEVEKEVIKVVKKPAASVANNASVNAASVANMNETIVKKPNINQALPSSDTNLSAFFNAQQQAAELHQQFLAIPQQYGETFSQLMAEHSKLVAAGLAIPESLQRSMEMFHQHQAQTLQSHTLFLQQQAQISQSTLAALAGTQVQTQAHTASQLPTETQTPAQAQVSAQVSAPVHQVAPQPAEQSKKQAVQSAPAAITQPAQSLAATATPVVPVPVSAPISEPATSPDSAQQPAKHSTVQSTEQSTNGLSTKQVHDTMMSVVADKTGYPTEMLELEMDMEADLGIDSIKRVEILGTVQDELPTLPELSPEDLAECRTLGEIVSYMESQLATDTAPVAVETSPSATQVATTGLSAEQVHNTMMAVVADKTGYPTEMLELGMDMEADLGIDSIKRVEILGTVQDELPELPELSPEDLAECRTLGEIVNYMESQLAASATDSAHSVATVPATPAPSTSTGLSAEQVHNTMMAVVADKTGYPVEMLELGMDMEADLGIDSIKRVEILGTVQDELPTLPELSPEDLAECRTLGEIVSYMESQLATDTAPAATETSQSATQVTATGLSAEQVHNTMMAVVADKTGYPVEMLELGMDMEADLGIDSIKRVEILGTVQDELPTLPELSPEDLAECRTLGEIVSYMESQLATDTVDTTTTSAPAAPTQSSATDLSAEQVHNTMMAVVADKTGYPVEMLELGMDMEADLGIDSIKRVEILGTVQDELPSLPDLNPEDLAECRTLGEIVSYMESKLDSSESSLQIQDVAPAAIDTTELPPHQEVSLKKLPAADKLVDAFAKDACIVINDDGHNGGVLAEKLNAAGLSVAVVRAPQSIVSAHAPISSDIATFNLEQISDDAIAAVLAQIGQQYQIAGLVHLQPQHSADDAIGLNDAAFHSVEQAFLSAKHLQAKLTEKARDERCCFITVSRIDGGFGYANSNDLTSAELNQAALSGLSKTLSHEWPQVLCRALDIVPDMEAVDLSHAIISELFDTDTQTTEIAINANARYKLVASTQADAQLTKAELNQDDCILVTGGAKGVTFECARTLAKQTQSHFVLAGRSQHLGTDLPLWAQGKNANELKAAAIKHIQAQGEKPTPKQIDALVWPVASSLEIDAALAAFSQVGASAQYISMDVSEPQAIEAALQNVKAISGIIHGAGVLADKHIQDKTLAELGRVYGTKVTGLANLLKVIEPTQLKLLAMFSSAAGFYGNTGQSDYAMSNEILNKTALKFAKQLPQAKVMSFNWGPWDGGMVSSALKKMFVERGVYVIPLDKGADLFAHKLLSTGGTQLLIGSSMQGSSTSNKTEDSAKKLNANSGNNVDNDLNIDAEGSLTLRAALSNTTAQGEVIVERTLDPLTLPLLADHCIAGNPVLPTVCAIEWMKQVAENITGKPVMIKDYKLLKGIVFETKAAHELQLTLTQTATGLNALISSRLAGSEQAYRPQYQATIVQASSAQTQLVSANSLTQTALSLQELQAKLAIDGVEPTNHLLTNKAELYSNGTLFHGPSLQGIEQVLQLDEQQLICRVAMPAAAANTDTHSANGSGAQRFGASQPLAEDWLLQAMLVWAREQHGAASLPASIGEMIYGSPFGLGDGDGDTDGNSGYIKLEVVKSSKRSLTANVYLYHDDGRLSCAMLNAKTTISKTLNDAFLAPATPLAELKESS
ncbi:KR domain-containing protein [Shewanella maritima]|uniref:KR domain-containing protein n=1 Tax=Shewanella maritima TaxID=2520507 RepID=A0A411PKK3_9GAMM|nr:KR domain-containing protein [Shewanella maritima]